jgi:hypothetical protein
MTATLKVDFVVIASAFAAMFSCKKLRREILVMLFHRIVQILEAPTKC